MKPRVKICGLTRPEDARLARELGADYFGVIFYPKSPRYVKESSVADLLAVIPAGQRVAVEVAPAQGKLKKRQALGFDFFQVHYDPAKVTDGTLTDWMNEVGGDKLWLAPHLPPGPEFPAAALKVANTLLVDTYRKDIYGGTGHAGDWPRFKSLSQAHPKHQWILSGGLNPDNVVDAVRATQAKILDVNSGVETSPGVKCAIKLDLLFAKLFGLGGA